VRRPIPFAGPNACPSVNPRQGIAYTAAAFFNDGTEWICLRLCTPRDEKRKTQAEEQRGGCFQQSRCTPKGGGVQVSVAQDAIVIVIA